MRKISAISRNTQNFLTILRQFNENYEQIMDTLIVEWPENDELVPKVRRID
jgi:hypothetical protein